MPPGFARRKGDEEMKTLRKAKISSVGAYVPDNIMKNSDFEALLDTTDEWIVTRTGIKQRHIVSKENPMTTAYLGSQAARSALDQAGCTPDDIDAIICATFSPDAFFPSTACEIQNLLGCKKAFAFDVSAACAGFVYGLTLANNYVCLGQCDTVLVIGAEVISKTLDWSDRSTCVLFGDGAGAVVVQPSASEEIGIGESCLRTDGTLGGILTLPAWGDDRTIKMKGGEVFKCAVNMMSETSIEVLKKMGISGEDLDYLIPHQANSRILYSIADYISLSKDKVVINLDKYGNTSSASIPLALNDIWSEGKITQGTKVLFTALGGGIAAGSIFVSF